MTTKKAIGWLGFAAAIVLLAHSSAGAQTTTLAASISGRNVTLGWGVIPGASGYQIEVGSAPGLSNLVVFQFPSPSFTGGTIGGVPYGTYYVRVRGFAPGVLGPPSNEVQVVVTNLTCGPPVLSVAVSNANVTFSWTPVLNATAYQVRAGYTPGSSDAVLNAASTATSIGAVAPAVGTYYARLVSLGGCGTQTSAEIPVVVTSVGSGNGPRTPDPPPGQRLPLPGYGASVTQAVASAYSGDLRTSCVASGGTNTWLFRLVRELRTRDTRWGLNWKRGNRGDMSQDIVTYNYASGPDEDTTNVYIIDVIGGHCGSNPTAGWNDVTQVTIDSGTLGRWTLQPYLAAGFPADVPEH
jgi:hypothetical protein